MLKGLSTLCVAVILLSGCGTGSSSTNTDSTVTVTDTSTTVVMPADTMAKPDSMLPVDSSADTKPDGKKTKQ